jgi:hypothetical protein
MFGNNASDTLEVYENCNENHGHLGCEMVYSGRWKQQVPPKCWKPMDPSVMKKKYDGVTYSTCPSTLSPPHDPSSMVTVARPYHTTVHGTTS